MDSENFDIDIFSKSIVINTTDVKVSFNRNRISRQTGKKVAELYLTMTKQEVSKEMNIPADVIERFLAKNKLL